MNNKEEKPKDLQLPSGFFHAPLLILKSSCLPFSTYEQFAVAEAPSSAGLGRAMLLPPLILMPKAQFQHIRLVFI